MGPKSNWSLFTREGEQKNAIVKRSKRRESKQVFPDIYTAAMTMGETNNLLACINVALF